MAAWFQDITQSTKLNLETQNATLMALRKGPGPVAPPHPPEPRHSRQPIQPSVPAAGKGGFDVAQINSFRIMDEELENQVGCKINYKAILDKKKKFL